MRKKIYIGLFFILFFVSLSYGYDDSRKEVKESHPENSNIGPESVETESVSYGPSHSYPGEAKESYAYYNPHAGQIVEVSANQKSFSGNTRNTLASQRTVPTRSFYNRHAGQQVEMPVGDLSQNNWKETLISSPGETKVLRYNPYANEWQRTAPETALTFNPRKGTWSYQKQGAYPRYNSYADTWEEATADEKLKYDSEADAWSYQK